MMNTLLISFGDGVMTGRIEWPISGLALAITLVLAFALLLMGLLRESRPDSIVRTTPTRLRPTLPMQLPQRQAA
jgi:hypothetical protein